MVFMKYRKLCGKFSQKEILELSVATVALAIALFNLFFRNLGPGYFLLALLFSALSFIPHELAHRFTAGYMNTRAKFELFPLGVALAIISSFFGFIFAAPGAVRLYSREEERYGLVITELTPRQLALIAMAGPLFNIIFGLLFLTLGKFFPPAIFGAKLNFFLAFFNLIPVQPLDGAKAILWRTKYWFVLILASFLLWILV
jgi:Zn-dependent protease